MTHSKSFLGLGLSHILCGLALGPFLGTRPVSILGSMYIGLVLGQLSLLGMWAAMATASWPKRYAAFLAGLLCIILQLRFFSGRWDVGLNLLIFLLPAVVACVFFVIRRTLVHVVNVNTDLPLGKKDFQFSVKALMLFVFVVACVLGVGRLVGAYVARADEIAIVLAICVCLIAMAMISSWAMLAVSDVWLGSLLVMSIALTTACLPKYINTRAQLRHCIAVMVTDVVVLLATLFVVRQLGFRFSRLPNRAKFSTDKLVESPF